MSTFYGQAATIANIPIPAAAVNIASSTNATPIVVTTSGAHGLQTGQIVIVNGHLVNTNANGVWFAFALSSTTYRLLTLAGANSVGNGVGVATGTSQSLGMPGITLPEDAIHDIDASSVNVPFEALADMVAWLAYTTQAKIRILAGGSATLLSGSTLQVVAGATGTVNGVMNFETSGPTAPQLNINSGTVSFPAPQRLVDAAATISVTDGMVVIFDAAPSTARLISVSAPAKDGLWIDFYLNIASANPATNYYAIKRAGSGNQIARLQGWGAAAGISLDTGHVRIHSEGGVWRRTGGHGYEDGSDA